MTSIMNKKLIAWLTASVFIAGSSALAFASESSNSGQLNSDNKNSSFSQHKWMFWMMSNVDHMHGQYIDKNSLLKTVTKSFVNTDSWAVITLTTSDTWSLAILQKESTEISKNSKDNGKMTTSIVSLSNWIQITLSSSDPTCIKMIQSRASNPKDLGLWFGMSRGWKMHNGQMGFENGWMSHMAPFWLKKTDLDLIKKNVTKSVVNTASGVQVSLTTSDSTTLSLLQSKSSEFEKMPKPANSKFTISTSSLTNGVEIDVSSSDPATITNIQTRAAKEGFDIWFGQWRNNWMNFNKIKNSLSNVSKSVTNTSSGVQITMTTTDPKLLTILQSKTADMSKYQPKDWKRTITAENISNWIVITISSSDPATITLIQTNSANSKEFWFGFWHQNK